MKKRAAAIIIRNKKLLVLHRQKPDRDYYTIPGGGVQLNESFKEACIREVKEETGLDVIAVQLVRKYITLEKAEYYYVVQVTPGEPVLGGPEVEHQSAENQYEFEWVDAKRFAEINLTPESARRICLEISQDIF
jgi:8-oxo-dGTP diphosphatase